MRTRVSQLLRRKKDFKEVVVLAADCYLANLRRDCRAPTPTSTRKAVAYTRGWADAKFNVVKTVHKSSLRAGRELASYGKEPEAVRLPFPEFACHGGGTPDHCNSEHN